MRLNSSLNLEARRVLVSLQGKIFRMRGYPPDFDPLASWGLSTVEHQPISYDLAERLLLKGA